MSCFSGCSPHCCGLDSVLEQGHGGLRGLSTQSAAHSQEFLRVNGRISAVGARADVGRIVGHDPETGQGSPVLLKAS